MLEALDVPRAGVKGGCKPPNMGAGNGVQSFRRTVLAFNH